MGSGEWGEEERVQGAGGRGEEEWLLSNRKFKIISNSPLLPAPLPLNSPLHPALCPPASSLAF